MAEARHQNSNTKVLKSGGTSYLNGRKGPEPDEIGRLLNLRQIEHEFGLSDYQVYRAVREGRLHALQVGGKGRVYYAEWEVRSLGRPDYRASGVAA
jgi:predicted DNA-binding transcriptional regulator AlpA